MDNSQLTKATSRYMIEALKDSRWEAYRIAPAVWHYGPTGPPDHAHLQNGVKVSTKGYEWMEGRVDLQLTCADWLGTLAMLRLRGMLFFWLN